MGLTLYIQNIKHRRYCFITNCLKAMVMLILLKKNEKENIIRFWNEEDADKPKFAFPVGNEEESDILRKIYNNDFEDIRNH